MTRIITASILTAFVATGAFAKAHDQGQSTVPGEGVGETTVTSAQTLGGGQGNRPDDKGPTNSQGPANAGR